MSSEGSVSMMIEGDGDKELPDEDEVTGNRVEERENVVKDCEFKVETVNGGVQSGDVGTLQDKGSQVQQQERSQEAVICWERFLHVTSIKVLLVENDDSTRHVLTALLRNCKYEVIQAANGLQAWNILENHTNQIDLVLSELVMPCLSGIGLLCKIMSHKTHKNIPVVLMSSHDSVGLVFKCLSKGAADFLVKPIRKNELKNLWQHVWRRCQSSSGSGSGSGTQTQKSVKSKRSENSGNNSGSYDGEDNQGNAPLGNGSDDGSDTQSSWTKKAVEVDSSQAVSPCDQAPERGDSTCAQVVRSNAETSAQKEAHMNPSRDCQEELDNTGNSKPSIAGSLRDPELEPKNAIKLPVELLGTKKSALEIDSNASSLKMDIKKENRISNRPPSEHHIRTADMSHPQIERRELNKVVDASEINNTSTNDSKIYVVEPSLKRLRGLRESGITFQDDRNVLRQSELSAFSRYNSSSNLTRTPNEITRSSSLIENSLEIAKNNPVHDIEAHMNKKLLNPSSNGVSNNVAMGSTSNILASKPLPLRDTVNSLHLSSAFNPVTSDCRNLSQQIPQVEPGERPITDVLPPESTHDIVIQHPHQHSDHHHFHNLNQHCTANHDDLSLKKLGMDSPHCASSKILAGSCEGNPEYQSLNRSASGSNHGSNGQNGSSNAENAGGTNGNSDAGLAGTSRSGDDASGSGSGNSTDSFKLVRAAALTKFRQKRKERCFEKKVRYHNRKKLAEQRPRVRGQFVRKIEQNNPTNTADE
ncbi:hypothetical protein HAX54_011058 [Datura stramonium]|uniref:Two-component response regulator-like APRR7 n=1 Tax=Datura stramonium TaxID=4076 RepID=A0ABS8X0W7_DATST|nr:hypothetical protein [Datura stramonium]